MWHCWICGSVEWDMNVKLDNTTEFVTLWISGTDEWDMTVKVDNTTEFATLLNVWECWIR